ncbi:hypothetical protein ABK040_007732 [Willaertia magna]
MYQSNDNSDSDNNDNQQDTSNITNQQQPHLYHNNQYLYTNQPPSCYYFYYNPPQLYYQQQLYYHQQQQQQLYYHQQQQQHYYQQQLHYNNSYNQPHYETAPSSSKDWRSGFNNGYHVDEYYNEDIVDTSNTNSNVDQNINKKDIPNPVIRDTNDKVKEKRKKTANRKKYERNLKKKKRKKERKSGYKFIENTELEKMGYETSDENGKINNKAVEMKNIVNEIQNLIDNYFKKKLWKEPKEDLNNENMYKAHIEVNEKLQMSKEEMDTERKLILKHYKNIMFKNNLNGYILTILAALYNSTKSVSTITILSLENKQKDTLQGKVYGYYVTKREMSNEPKKYALLEKSQNIKLLVLKILLDIFENWQENVDIEAIESYLYKTYNEKNKLKNSVKQKKSIKLQKQLNENQMDLKLIESLRTNRNYIELLEYFRRNNLLSIEDYSRTRGVLLDYQKDYLNNLKDDSILYNQRGIYSDVIYNEDENTLIASCKGFFIRQRMAQEMSKIKLLQNTIKGYLARRPLSIMRRYKKKQEEYDKRVQENYQKFLETSPKKTDKYLVGTNDLSANVVSDLPIMLLINNSLGYIPLVLTDLISLLPLQYCTAQCINSQCEMLNSKYPNNLYLNSCMYDIIMDHSFSEYYSLYEYYTNIDFKNVNTIVLPINGENNNHFKQILYYFKNNNTIVYVDNYNKCYDNHLLKRFKDLINYFYHRDQVTIDMENMEVQKPKGKRIPYERDCALVAMYYLEKATDYRSLIYNINAITYPDSILELRKYFYSLFINENKRKNPNHYYYYTSNDGINERIVPNNDLDNLQSHALKVFQSFTNTLSSFCLDFDTIVIGRGYLKICNKMWLEMYCCFKDIYFHPSDTKEQLINIIAQTIDTVGKEQTMNKEDFKNKISTTVEEIEKEYENYLLTINNYITNEIYGGDEFYKSNCLEKNLQGHLEDYLSNVFTKSPNKQLFHNNQVTCNHFKSYLDTRKLTIRQLLSQNKIYIIDFECFISEADLILPSEFTIVDTKFNFQTNSFGSHNNLNYYHYLIEYPDYQIFPEDYYYRKPQRTEEGDTLILHDGFTKRVIEYKYLKTINAIYSCLTNIPFYHNTRYKVDKFRHYKLYRKEMPDTIKNIIKSGICFAKGADMEQKLLSIFEKEIRVEMPKVFELYDLLKLLGYNKNPNDLNTSIKDNQRNMFLNSCCDFHNSVNIKLKDRKKKDREIVAHCSKRDVCSYVNELLTLAVHID